MTSWCSGSRVVRSGGNLRHERRRVMGAFTLRYIKGMFSAPRRALRFRKVLFGSNPRQVERSEAKPDAWTASSAQLEPTSSTTVDCGPE
ncbi:MAG: hypothetical protein C4326_14270 [Ignavibacteria bacterium]